jgi:hypothetical protein
MNDNSPSDNLLVALKRREIEQFSSNRDTGDVYCSGDIHCMHYSIVLRVLYSLVLSSMYP